VYKIINLELILKLIQVLRCGDWTLGQCWGGSCTINSLQQWQQAKRPFRASQSKSNRNEWRILSWRMNCLPTQRQFKIDQLPAKITTSSTCLFRDHESNIRHIEWWGFQISPKSITKIDTDIKAAAVRRRQTLTLTPADLNRSGQ
jgi:hypothetical protein